LFGGLFFCWLAYFAFFQHCIIQSGMKLVLKTIQKILYNAGRERIYGGQRLVSTTVWVTLSELSFRKVWLWFAAEIKNRR